MATGKVPKSVLLLLLYLVTVDDVTGHGAMVEPPMRSYAWKDNFDTPINYDWNQLFCGGFNHFKTHNGKCGVCGDPAGGPYENSNGGMFDTGIIVRHYPAGIGEIEVKVEITAHHKGYFEFKICDNNEAEVTQDCLDRHPLQIRESQPHDFAQRNAFRFYPPEGARVHELHVRLPPNMICDRCVLQWKYTAGNSAGVSPNGESCLGCGLQETFVNCADISIGGSRDFMPRRSRGDIGPEVVINKLEDVSNIINAVRPNVVEENVMLPNNNVNNNNNNNNNNNIINSNPDMNMNMNNFWNVDQQNSAMATIQPGNVPNTGMMVTRIPMPTLSDINARAHSNPMPSLISQLVNSHQHNHNSVVNTHRSIFASISSPGSSFLPSGTFNNRLPVIHPEQNHVPRPSAVDIPTQNVHDHIKQVLHSRINNIPQFPSQQHLLPPPSRVTNLLHSNVNSHVNHLPRDPLVNTGSGSTLLGSMESVVNRIVNPNQVSSFSHTAPERHVSSPGGSIFPPNQNLNMHASQQNSLHQHSLSIASNNALNTHQNFHPSVLAAVKHSRENWLSGQQSQLSRHKLLTNNSLRISANNVSRRWLPRRIVVPNASVAQHILSKYPQLRGRVYLARQSRADSTHMYARRRNHL